VEIYSNDFYATMEVGSNSSAREIVPMLLSRYSPKSVVDVGCGTGSFANEFLKLGVSEVVGYEGAWMESLPTLLPKSHYRYHDLTKNLSSAKSYDLCLCLEVAEHISDKYAENLVAILTSMSSTIVFSAAIPKQGGNHHVNEQWPSYWSKLFAARGFYLEWDPRQSFWENHKIEACYRQNLLVYSQVSTNQQIEPAALVHPDIWLNAMLFRKVSFGRKLISKLPIQVFVFRRYLLRRLRRN
jgi:hypothetical protein